MAQVLGLRRLQEYFQVLNAILSDLMSRIWMTYRRGFPPICGSGITSDVGWGCTLRSGQMLLAQALVYHLVGRQWRRKLEAAYPEEVAQVLQWFGDQACEQRPFSIHNMCTTGQTHGVKAGDWLGPSGLCHTLADMVNKVQPGGLQCRVVATFGGGAPVLCTSRLATAFEGGADRSGGEVGSSGSEESGPAGQGLLLLIPLMLGLNGKINPRYCAQLQQLLTWPQSVGIVGGRPSSSLYFIGLQDQHVLYLDPHEVQEVASEAADLDTYFCSSLRLMPLANIDPSLAIGFYCSSLSDFEDLCGRLRTLEAEAGCAPLVCMVDEDAGEPSWPAEEVLSDEGIPSDADSPAPPAGGANRDNWEML
ncbi:peptidase C54 [Coccomyxa subellipsoidea C-169]|uniref:Cysteine protease n=1 Tax=Coccomyxa subellipsoidea (strain C-169) TaxID=574566 RepID=I0Z904_COCSC|nr:peptidase C54 [Coccomyxa subellipsoidea C-169]EIE27123.1 peptidase C54 [Coccomyxa subellipsoidea C-169]|eukprot:XP_005651667.1 peptidase C54 [Coccomyxa subellipsoidea C-169]